MYRDVLAGYPAEALPDTLTHQHEETDHMVAETIAGWSADYPDIPVD